MANLVSALDRLRAEQRAAAARDYRDVLRRAESPEPDDAEKLGRAMAILGLSDADLGVHMSALRRYGELAAVQERAAAAGRELVAVDQRIAEYERRGAELGRQLEALKAEARPTYEQRHALAAVIDGGQAAAGEMQRVATAHPLLFGA